MPMQITAFDPRSGGTGTSVTISVSGMPTAATQQNTKVFLSGDLLRVDDFELDESGNGTIGVTIARSSQSGDLEVVVILGNDYPTARSAEIFTVDKLPDEPVLTSLNPRSAQSGTLITLQGRNLDQIQSVTAGTTNLYVLSTHTPSTIRFTLPASVQPGNQRITGRSQEYGRVNCPYVLNVT